MYHVSRQKLSFFSHNVLSLTDKNSSDYDSVGKTHYLWADIGEKTHKMLSKT